MYKNILVPTDLSEFSMKALRSALGLARAFNSVVTILHAVPHDIRPVLDEGCGYPEAYFCNAEIEQAFESRAAEWLKGVEEEAASVQVECVSVVVHNNQPWKAIIEAARSRECDLIVMASHCRHGLKALLPGGETSRILHELETPVLVCH